jgi:hypothetical protein
MDAVQLAVLYAPEDVLDGVAAPAVVRRVPTKEILVSVR